MSGGQTATSARRLSLPFVAATLAVAFTLGVLAGFGLPRVLGSASHATAAAAPGILGARSALTPDVARDGLAAIRADEKTPLTSIQLAPLVEGALAAIRADEKTPLTSIQLAPLVEGALSDVRAAEKTPLTSIQLAPLVEGALIDVRAAERTMASAGAARHGPIAHTPDVAENNMSDAAYAARFGSR